MSVRALKTSLGVDLTIQTELYKHRPESTGAGIFQLGPQSTVLLGGKESPQLDLRISRCMWRFLKNNN